MTIPDKSSARKPASERRRSGWRRWLAALVVCAIAPGALIALLESGLRVAGLGYSTQFFLKRDLAGTPCYVTNKNFYQQFYGLPLLRGQRDNFEFQIPRAKPPDIFRVFVFGESAALGQPPDAAYAFWRILEAMLIARYPGVVFEFYTPAMPGANSNVMWAAARACAKMQPDLYVVYMGNNEFCGPFGPVTQIAGRPLWNIPLIRANILLTDLRLAQLVTGRLWQVDPTVCIEPANIVLVYDKLRPEDPRVDRMYTHFERNLTDICNAGTGAGASVVLCTVGANLRHWGPSVSENRPDISPHEQEQWNAAFQAGAAREDSDHQAALDAYERAAAIDDTHAELLYRMGRCHWSLGGFDKARECFFRALERDLYPTRSCAPLNAHVRKVAQALSGNGVYLADAVVRMEECSPHGVPGRECFYDYVHMTFHGHYVLARAVFEQVVQALPDWVRQQGPDAHVTPLSEDECAQRLAFTPYVEQGHIAQFFNLMTACQDKIIEVREGLALLRQRHDELQRQNGSEGLARTMDAYRQSLQWNDRDYYLRKRYVEDLLDTGHVTEMIGEAQALLDRFPCRRDTKRLVGMALKAAGRDQEAIKAFRATLADYPDDAESYCFLGDLYFGQGRFDEALAMFRASLAINPANAYARKCAGETLEKQGDAEAAMAAYRAAIALDAGMTPAYDDLDQAWIARGDVEGRIAEWRGVAERNPRASAPQCYLARALEAAGRMDEAATAYRTAAERNPHSVDAKVYMAKAFEAGRNVDAAIRTYQEAIAMDPSSPTAFEGLEALLAKRNNPDGRIAVWRETAAAHPNVARACYYLGMALAAKPDAAAAIEAYRKAAELAPGDAGMQAALGQAFVGNNDFAAAVAPLRSALQMNKLFTRHVRPDFVRALYETKDYQGARNEAEKCRQTGIGLPPDLVEKLAVLGGKHP